MKYQIANIEPIRDRVHPRFWLKEIVQVARSNSTNLLHANKLDRLGEVSIADGKKKKLGLTHSCINGIQFYPIMTKHNGELVIAGIFAPQDFNKLLSSLPENQSAPRV